MLRCISSRVQNERIVLVVIHDSPNLFQVVFVPESKEVNV
jgi:hypothetical protein